MEDYAVSRRSFCRFLLSIPHYHTTPHGGAVQADISSANTVGYSSQSLNADQWYLVGVQFADVASANETADFNSLISTTCTPGEFGDGTDGTMGNAPEIQVLNAAGNGYAHYYYISDADDGTEVYNLTGWVDDSGNLVGSEALLTLSKGFWIRSKTSGSLTCAGQVSALSTFTRDIPAGHFEIVANPYPIALDLNAPTTAGITPGEFGDGTDGTMGNAPEIQVLNATGNGYAHYYYISDADDGTEVYNLTGWVDDSGNLVTGAQIGVGAAFWIKSAGAGMFTFGR